jgi:hypothetical protein
MANLQVKGVEDGLYQEIKKMAAEENRSVSQQVLFLLKDYMAKRHRLSSTETPAKTLLELAGSWEDERDAEAIIREIREARRR